MEALNQDFLDRLDKVVDFRRVEALKILMEVYDNQSITLCIALVLEGVRSIINGAPDPILAEYIRTKVLEILYETKEKDND